MKRLCGYCLIMILLIVTVLLGINSVCVFGDDGGQETTIQYRYREKEFTTSQDELEEPWVLYDTQTRYNHSGYKYTYLRYATVSGTGTTSGYTSAQADAWYSANVDNYCFHGTKTLTYHYMRKTGYSSGSADLYLTESQLDTVDYEKYTYSGNKYWRFQYCTNKTSYLLYYYYMWGNWSEWSDTPCTATDDIEVETREIYTVSYDANGGTNVPESQKKIQDEDVVLSSTIPTREGYTFSGWSTTADGLVEYNPGDTCSVNETMTLYAVWEIDVISATGITLDKTSVTLDVGTNETLIATIAPADATNQNVLWTSSNTSVATIENGTVTAVGSGTATITVTTEDGGFTAICTVTVNEPEPPTISVTGITLDKTSVTLGVGENETLIATITPSDATNQNIIWSSSDESVATVENGMVTAVSAGTSTITVTTEDGGFTATCAVIVNSISEPETPIEPAEDEPTLTVGEVTGKSGETVTVSVTIENNPGILGMMLNISYDEELTLTALTQNIGEDDSALESLDFTPGKNLAENPINVGWDGLDADSTNGKILNMTFTIPEDAEDGNVYNIGLSYTAGNVYDNDFNDIDLAIINGSITVKNYTIGDVNDDGTINMKDVTLLRRGVIGGYGVTLSEAADVNCDGVTNMKDVTILRRYVIGGYGVTLG